MNAHRVCLALLLATAACMSAPKIGHYTLAVEASGTVRPALNLEVERLLASETLRDPRIYIQASPTRVEYYATERWAGSLGELVQRKLVIEFGPASPGRRTLKVGGVVLACGQLDREEGAAAHVKLAIELRDPESRRSQPPLLEKTYEATMPVAAPVAGEVVTALSRCVERIAGEIAADAEEL